MKDGLAGGAGVEVHDVDVGGAQRMLECYSFPGRYGCRCYPICRLRRAYIPNSALSFTNAKQVS